MGGRLWGWRGSVALRWPLAGVVAPMLAYVGSRIVTEVVLEGVGHSPHLERPALFRRALLEVIGYIGAPADPAPPTEAIILSSSD